ncbi:hypothetical protein [Rhizobium freirei]|uniref:hypothetical protein n=1 Tax=Rhizobium freirei TaxID=1353277 RepID=UPI00056469A5|nr:hypothetical protein [Rhizobium freirei]
MATSGSPHINRNDRHCHDDRRATRGIHSPLQAIATPLFQSQLREVIVVIQAQTSALQIALSVAKASTRIIPNQTNKTFALMEKQFLF